MTFVNSPTGNAPLGVVHQSLGHYRGGRAIIGRPHNKSLILGIVLTGYLYFEKRRVGVNCAHSSEDRIAKPSSHVGVGQTGGPLLRGICAGEGQTEIDLVPSIIEKTLCAKQPAEDHGSRNVCPSEHAPDTEFEIAQLDGI